MNEFFKDIDNMDSAFPQYEAECQGCDIFLPVNDLWSSPKKLEIELSQFFQFVPN